MNELRRKVGLPGAIFMGLGSILGTGIFVSIGIAAGVAGSAVVVAVTLVALVAICNGLSSAQLAASHPVSGGTYAYGYRYLNPALGFTAGWLFLLAKSASAATAALGFAGYATAMLGIPSATARMALGTVIAVVLTVLVAGGIQRSNRINAVIVSATLGALAAFVFASLPLMFASGAEKITPIFSRELLDSNLWHATALMFVAYTGYGRIATLGEEVVEPGRTIPRAVIATLLITMALYVSVAAAGLSSLGADGLAAATHEAVAPLEVAARRAGGQTLGLIVAAGALTAMAGVLLNLILGLSRVLLAMARNGDMPRWFAAISVDGSPKRAVFGMGAMVTGLVLLGSVKVTWSFSAFTVLGHYAITNLAALRLPQESRRYPRIVALLGLVSCLSLAFWIEKEIWLPALGVVAGGLVWHSAARWKTGRAR